MGLLWVLFLGQKNEKLMTEKFGNEEIMCLSPLPVTPLLSAVSDSGSP